MDAYRHVQRLELAWFEDQSTGGLLAILNDDVNQLERFLDMGAQDLIRTLVNIIFVGVVFFVASPVLGWWRSCPSRSSCGARSATSGASSPATPRCGGRPATWGALANNVGHRHHPLVHRRGPETARVDGVRRLPPRPTAAIKLSSAFIPLIRMAILAGFTITLVLGGQAALNGSLEIGLFSVLVYMTQRLLWP